MRSLLPHGQGSTDYAGRRLPGCRHHAAVRPSSQGGCVGHGAPADGDRLAARPVNKEDPSLYSGYSVPRIVFQLLVADSVYNSDKERYHGYSGGHLDAELTCAYWSLPAKEFYGTGDPERAWRVA